MERRAVNMIVGRLLGDVCFEWWKIESLLTKWKTKCFN
jgi:hypothetical protein